MNYVMSGWPGRDPPRGGSEGPPLGGGSRSGEGPCRARQGGGLVPFSTAPCLRVSDCCGSAGRATTPRGVAGCRCDLRHRIDGHCPPGVCGGGPTGPAGVVAYTRDATTPPPGVVEAPVPSTVLLFHISEHMHICTHEKKERRLP